MSSTRSDKYNQIQKDTRRFYEVELVMLINFILSTTDISLSRMAQAMGVSRQSLTDRVNRYRIEQLDQEEEEEEEDDSDEDIDFSRMENDDYHHYSGDNSSC